MHRLIVGAVAFLAVTLRATAEAQEATHNWTGFYAGLSAGGAWGDNDVDVGCDDAQSTVGPGFCAFNAAGGFPPPHYSYDLNGFIGGGQAGYNVQTGNVVVGVEADISWTGLEGDDSVNRTIPFPTSGPASLGSISVSEDLAWLGTVRARLGWATGSWLVYATGGLAYGKVDYRHSLTFPNSDNFIAKDSQSEVQTGWTVGGGAEVAFGQWSLRGEYLYYDLGDQKLKAEWTTTSTPISGIFSRADFDDTQGHIARVGLNFHFD